MKPIWWQPGMKATAVRGDVAEITFRYAGNLFVDARAGVFRFSDHTGRVVADCPTYASLEAAHRLLTGGAQ